MNPDCVQDQQLQNPAVDAALHVQALEISHVLLEGRASEGFWGIGRSSSEDRGRLPGLKPWSLATVKLHGALCTEPLYQ